MPVRLGLDCKLFRNSSTWASPTFVEIEDVKDVTITLEKNAAEVTTRANNGWKATRAALKDATVEFDYIVNPDRADSVTDFEFLRDAWLNDSNVELWAADGPSDGGDTGEVTQGLRAWFNVMDMTQKQSLEDAQVFSFKCKPTLGANAPEWKEVTGT